MEVADQLWKVARGCKPAFGREWGACANQLGTKVLSTFKPMIRHQYKLMEVALVSENRALNHPQVEAVSSVMCPKATP